MKLSGHQLGLDKLELIDLKNVHRNLSVAELASDIVNNNEGVIGLRGAAMIDTGIYTGRSPKDKYIVDESSSNTKVWWGSVNRKISEEIYNEMDGNCIYNEDTRQLFYDGLENIDNFDMIRSGMQYVKENHTYINRVQSLLEVL